MSPARRGLLAVAMTVLLAAMVLVLLPNGAAAERTRAQTQAELDQVMQRQGQVSTSIEEQNRLIDSMIGAVAQTKARVDEASARLAEKEAQLAEANAELEQAEADLLESRRRLHRSLGSLRDVVVDIYRSGQSDWTGSVTVATDFATAVSEAEYLQRVNDQQNAVVERVEQLRDEADAAVERLTEVRARIAAARDQVAAVRAEAERARLQVQERWDALNAERARREATLATLEDRQAVLEEDLEVSVPAPGERARLVDGQAIAPADAPPEVKAAIAAANSIAHLPYVWGGGHGSFESSGYDCSGAVSYALNGAGLLDSPLDSTGLTFWGEPGEGGWITVYGHGGHAYVVIAGLRFDTSDTGGSGPRWHEDMRSPAGFIPRHPAGL